MKKPILCILGLHKPSKYVFIREERTRKRNKRRVVKYYDVYQCCKRCYKKLKLVSKD